MPTIWQQCASAWLKVNRTRYHKQHSWDNPPTASLLSPSQDTCLLILQSLQVLPMSHIPSNCKLAAALPRLLLHKPHFLTLFTLCIDNQPPFFPCILSAAAKAAYPNHPSQQITICSKAEYFHSSTNTKNKLFTQMFVPYRISLLVI